jgi:putative membrane protein
MTMMSWNDGSWSWAGWLMMTAAMVAFWGLVAWVAVTLVRSTSRRPEPTGAVAPEEILAARFARGEIDQAAYEERTATLRRERSHAH